MKYLLFLMAFGSQIIFSDAQNIKITKLSNNISSPLSKLMWTSGDTFCIVSPNMLQPEKNTYSIAFFDSSGNLIGNRIVIKSSKICKRVFTQVLNNGIFCFEYQSDEYGGYKLILKNIVYNADKHLDSVITIFNIRSIDENRKLNQSLYSFKIDKGIAAKKLLLSYNNDYKEEYREGFRFRIMDDSGHLSEEDTLQLPYGDRSCNIDDIIFDDAFNNIYLIGDLFELNGKGERQFEKSFIARYNVDTHEYKEINEGVHSFNNYTIQHFEDNENIFVSALKLEENSYDDWTSNFLMVKRNAFNIINSQTIKLEPEIIKLFSINNTKEENIIEPFCFQPINDSSWRVGWTNVSPMERRMFWRIEQNRAAQPGAAQLLDWDLIKDLKGVTVFVDYFSNNIKAFQRKVVSDIIKTRPFLSLPAFFSDSSKPMLMYNNVLKKTINETAICLTDFKNDRDCNDIFRNEFNSREINFLYPGSGLEYKGKYFFIADNNKELPLTLLSGKSNGSRILSGATKYYLIEVNMFK